MQSLLTGLWMDEEVPTSWKERLIMSYKSTINKIGTRIYSKYHNNTLHFIIEHLAELQSSFYLLFVNFERVFDTVDQTHMKIT